MKINTPCKFSSGEICELFGLKKTTLFRWEEAGCIPTPKRQFADSLCKKDMRIYSLEDVQAIACYILTLTVSQPVSEVKIKARFFTDSQLALKQCSQLVTTSSLSGSLIEFLCTQARQMPRSDPRRADIFKILYEDSKWTK